MQPAAEFFVQRGMNAALAFNPGYAFKGGGYDLDREMAFAARPVPGMARMQRAFIPHRQFQRREGGGEFAVYAFCDGHNHKRFARAGTKVKQ